MKTAFLLVLLTNLTLLMYEYHRGAFDPAAEKAATPDDTVLQEPIVLASEQKGGQTTGSDAARPAETGEQKPSAPEAALPPPVQESAPPPATACYEAGPFANDHLFKAWSGEIGTVQNASAPVLRSGREITDYLVLYPTSGAPEEIKAAMQALRGQGIGDAYPLPAGEYKGHISLGAFHRESQALRMQKDLQGKGIEAVVKPRFKETGRKYALFTAPVAMAERLDEVGRKYPDVRLRTMPDSDPDCRQSDAVRSEHAAAEAAESGAKQTAPRQALAGAEKGALRAAGSEISLPEGTEAEKKASKAGAGNAEKPPVQAERQKENSGVDGRGEAVCYEAGPFPDGQSLSVWQKQVAGARGTMKPVFREGKAVSGYLVLYPAKGGAEEIKAALQMLREHGLTDAWPLAGEDKGYISLGVFSKEENALQMQKSLLDKGVDSLVKPRHKSRRQRYALISGGEAVAESLRELEKNYPDTKLHRLPATEQGCP